MTFTDMVSTIQQIQSRLASLAPAPPTGSSGSAAAFADALSGAGATSTTPEISSTASTDGAVISSGGVTGNDVVQAALKYKGVPYVFGGESSSGMDCSGLVQKSFADLGITVPRLVHEQQAVGQKVDSLKDAKPGDLIVLNGGGHIAIYMGNDTVIHAPYEGRTVSVQKAWFTDKDIVAIRRIVPATGDAAAAAGGASSATGADVAALSAMLGRGSSSSVLGSTGGTSLSSLLSTLGATGSSSTAQQLLAARAAIGGGLT
ncbi:MAG TPA: C40 family peptidase [Amnibacterium sp.]|nr:C40 family peptidase [Amnibacterium sp.]